MEGVKASNGNYGQSGGPSRGRGGGDDAGERAPPGGSAEAEAAATRVLDDGERAPPGGSAEAGRAATGALDGGERASRRLSRSRGCGDTELRAHHLHEYFKFLPIEKCNINVEYHLKHRNDVPRGGL